MATTECQGSELAGAPVYPTGAFLRRGLSIAARTLLPAAAVGYAALTLSTVIPQLQMPWVTASLVEANWLDGSGADLFDQTFANMDPRRFMAREIAGVLRMNAFGELRPGAFAGEGGWLFNSDDIALPADARPLLDKAVAWVDRAREQLEAHGAELIVVLVPFKSEMESEHHGSAELAASGRRVREEFASRLEALDLPVIDPFDAWIEAKAEGEVTFRTDQHWTPWGAQVAAREIAAFAGKGQSGTIELRPLDTRAFQGDLSGGVGTPWATDHTPLTTEVVRPVGAYDADGNLLRPDWRDTDTVLVGTSASANEWWSFADHLSYELQVPVANMAISALGPFYPMRQALDDFAETGKYPERVIWEITLPSIFNPKHLAAEGEHRRPW